MIYANHAGTSWPKPDGVAEAVGEALTQGPARSAEIFESARATVCRFLGIADPERFLFTSSCTSALSVALDDLPWAPGDRVLTKSLEHHALGRPVQKLVETRGVRHLASPYRSGCPFDLDFARAELRRGDVRLIAITGASNVTERLLPVGEAARLAHEYDALCLVDAAQTVGVIPVDVRDLQVDLLVFAGHKGPLGPQGIGGLWAASHVTFDSPAAGCSSFPGYCDVGSVNVSGAAGLESGLLWRLENERGRGGELPRRLAHRLATELSRRPGCTLYGGRDVERTATVSLNLEGLPVAAAEDHFADHGIVVRAGEHCAPWAIEAIDAPGGTIRISFGWSSDDGDPAAILQAIDAVK